MMKLKIMALAAAATPVALLLLHAQSVQTDQDHPHCQIAATAQDSVVDSDHGPISILGSGPILPSAMLRQTGQKSAVCAN